MFRKSLVNALKNGDNLVIYMGRMARNLPEIF